MDDRKQIVWPINPSDSDGKIECHMNSFLKRLAVEFDFVVKPVCVINSDFFTTSDYFQPVDMGAIKNNLKVDCENYLKKFDHDFEELVLLENFYGSRRGEVATFMSYIESSDTDYIVIGSHGRKGWERAALGSFTESLLLKSTIPVFVIGPECTDLGELGKALMPVELSQSSESFLELFLDHHALSFLKSLKLFHKISMLDLEDIAWAPSLYGVGGVSTINIMERAKKETNRYLQSFLDHPLSKKRLSYEVSESLAPLADVVGECAGQSDVGLIVMRSESGFWATNVLGSITRQIIRDAKVPVVVYPHSCEKVY